MPQLPEFFYYNNSNLEKFNNTRRFQNIIIMRSDHPYIDFSYIRIFLEYASNEFGNSMGCLKGFYLPSKYNKKFRGHII